MIYPLFHSGEDAHQGDQKGKWGEAISGHSKEKKTAQSGATETQGYQKAGTVYEECRHLSLPSA